MEENSQKVIPESTVFILYDKNDWGRVKPLAKYLESKGADGGFAVWRDEEITFKITSSGAIRAIEEAKREARSRAACIVVVWTTTSVHSDYVNREADRGYRQGILLPVLLDSAARDLIPAPFNQLRALELTDWDGTEGTELRRLTERIEKLAEVGSDASSYYYAPLSSGEWVLNPPQDAVSEIGGLTSGLRSFREVLISDSASKKDLWGVLKEVSKTYDATYSAVKSFIKAGAKKPVEADTFVEIGHGTLRSDIKERRGHCLKILDYYYASGGLRDSIEDQLSPEHPEQLEQLDDIFTRLGTADKDLFKRLAEVGEHLTTESKVIVRLLYAGHEAAARQHVTDGIVMLERLEKRLEKARDDLLELQEDLTYTEPVGE